jgi:hypothetical protein
VVEIEMSKALLVRPQKKSEEHSRENPYCIRECLNHQKWMLAEIWMLKMLVMQSQEEIRSIVKKACIFLEDYLNPHRQNVHGNDSIRGVAAGESSKEMKNMLLEIEIKEILVN